MIFKRLGFSAVLAAATLSVLAPPSGAITAGGSTATATRTWGSSTSTSRTGGSGARRRRCRTPC